MITDQIEKLEAMARAGATIVLKMDGPRFSHGDSKLFTLMVSGGELSVDDFFRLDGESLGEVIAEAINYYYRNRTS